ncbi:MAG: ankyrin repeat domain-containing protein [Candidatus Dependentiae bacterium]|nr:ankyrin repeat domain-containing protein [Candidatus Dependentiae bacterium]
MKELSSILLILSILLTVTPYIRASQTATTNTMSQGAEPKGANKQLLDAIAEKDPQKWPTAIDAALQAGADINFQAKDGTTPLRQAVRTGNTKIVETLLKNPTIDINLVDNQSLTPLMSAIVRNHKDIVSVLIKDPRINPNIQSNIGRNALHLAVVSKNPETLKLITGNVLITKLNLSAKEKDGFTPLTMAKKLAEITKDKDQKLADVYKNMAAHLETAEKIQRDQIEGRKQALKELEDAGATHMPSDLLEDGENDTFKLMEEYKSGGFGQVYRN